MSVQKEHRGWEESRKGGCETVAGLHRMEREEQGPGILTPAGMRAPGVHMLQA